MTLPTPERLQALVERVRASIPRRPRPKAKPRATWHGLRKGTKLRQGAVEWEVEACDTGGVTLRVCCPFRGTSTLYLTDERDLEVFVKVPKPRKPRKKKEPSDG